MDSIALQRGCVPSPTFTAALEVHDLLVVQHSNVKSRSRGTVAAAALPTAAAPPTLRGHAKPSTQPACLPLPPPHLLLLLPLSLVAAPSSTPLTNTTLIALLLLSVPVNRAPLPQLIHEVGCEGRPV